MAKAKQIDLFYFDQSGFSLKSNIPYAWQKKGEEISIKTSRSQNITVSGFISSDGQKLIKSMTVKSVTSEIVIKIFDDFASQIKGKTYVVLDNASIHTSRLFTSKIEEWKKIGLNIIYLPPYSPQLNKIEILWRFIKYQWIGISAYLSVKNLKDKLNYIFDNFGSEYTINFA